MKNREIYKVYLKVLLINFLIVSMSIPRINYLQVLIIDT